MLVTLFGIVNVLPVFPAGYVIKVVLALLYNMPSCEQYVVLAVSTFIAVRLVQTEKAYTPMLVTLLGIVTLISFSHQEKALKPMMVTLLGIVMLVRLVQLSKALSPMMVTLLGIVTLVRLVQYAKA